MPGCSRHTVTYDGHRPSCDRFCISDDTNPTLVCNPARKQTAASTPSYNSENAGLFVTKRLENAHAVKTVKKSGNFLLKKTPNRNTVKKVAAKYERAL